MSTSLVRQLSRNARATREVFRGLLDTDHPLLVHIVPVRRCNIACGYCNEYDKVSQPVPIDRLERWVDRLAELGTSVVACSGGDPLLHPELERLIRRVRSRGMLAGLITNGYLLSPKKIESLNAAGLDFLQTSIDNVEPDEVSKKGLRLLDRKLEPCAPFCTIGCVHRVSTMDFWRRPQKPRSRHQTAPCPDAQG